MSVFMLRLCEDRLTAGGRLGPLAAAQRVLYGRAGDVVVEAGGTQVTLAANAAWYGPGVCALTAGDRGAEVLRYELLPERAAGDADGPVLLAQTVELDPSAAWLIRCDRVDFAPGAVAMPHSHRGGGIRCLIEGALTVQVGAHPARVMRPGDAWYESGREPVRADASPTEPTSFIRVALLPAEIRGQSSIWYVDPSAARITPRSYTVFVDEPIQLD